MSWRYCSRWGCTCSDDNIWPRGDEKVFSDVILLGVIGSSNKLKCWSMTDDDSTPPVVDAEVLDRLRTLRGVVGVWFIFVCWGITLEKGCEKVFCRFNLVLAWSNDVLWMDCRTLVQVVNICFCAKIKEGRIDIGSGNVWGCCWCLEIGTVGPFWGRSDGCRLNGTLCLVPKARSERRWWNTWCWHSWTKDRIIFNHCSCLSHVSKLLLLL